MVKSGKNIKYISADSYAGVIDESTFSTGSYLSLGIDPIRYYSKNFWTTSNNEFVHASSVGGEKLFDIEYLHNDQILIKANRDKFSNRVINDRGLFEKQFDTLTWELFIRDIVQPSQVFEDYYVDFQEPIQSKDKNEDSNISYINKEFVYNFYCDKYENLLTNKLFNEAIIPGSSQLAEANINPSNEFVKNLHILFGGVLPASLGDAFLKAKEYNDSLKDYFNAFLEAYNKDAYGLAFNDITQNNSNIKYHKKHNEFLKTLNYIPYPMYCDIKFSSATDRNGISSKIYNIGNIYDYFQQFFLDYEPHTFRKYINDSADSANNVTLNEYDLKSMINQDIEGFRSPGTADNVRIFNQDDIFYKNVEYANLLKYLKDNVSPLKRHYKDLTNKSCVYDILLYKLEKRNRSDNAVLQTVWIDPNGTDYIRYIDSHIKYGELYNYSLKAYTIIIGNSYTYQKYDYSNDELGRLADIKNGCYRYVVNNKASYKIVEIPVATFNGMAQEMPFNKPLYDIKKDGDNIRFILSDSVVDSLETHELLENEDFDIYEKVKLSQGSIDKIKSIKPSDKPIKLEIYKTTVKPTSYISFQGKKYKTLLMDSKKTFIDTIVPNIKYYYLMRYLNIHGIPSNVSRIIEVTMKEEDEYYYLVTNEVDFHASSGKVDKKDFKRYLLIRPSSIQTHPTNIDNPHGIDGVKLGPNKEPVWEKDFIIRVKSKKTNRILEFNLKSKINRKKH